MRTLLLFEAILFFFGGFLRHLDFAARPAQFIAHVVLLATFLGQRSFQLFNFAHRFTGGKAHPTSGSASH